MHLHAPYRCALILKLSLLFAIGQIFDTEKIYAQGIITHASLDFGVYSGQTDPEANTLYCGLDVNTNLGLNHTNVISSSEYQLNVSLDANFGGIGTGITLINPSNLAAANIVQTASGAGAAWQTSYFIYDTQGDRLIVFNQAAGNDVNYQWGYSNKVTNLTETAWSPLWSDHYHPTYLQTGFENQVGTSPCMGSGFHFDDGRGSIISNPIETPYGNVTHMTNTYQLKSNEDQSWGFVGVDQSLYLNGVVAVQSSLQMTVVGKSGWVQGPFSPVHKFSISRGIGNCSQIGCSYQMGPDVAYIFLSYVIGGQSYGIVIEEPNSSAVIIQTLTPYCTLNSNPEDCGAVQIHSFLTSNQPVTVSKGEIRSYQLEYYIGTMSQLGAIGFNPDEGINVENYAAGQASVCKSDTQATSNNQLTNHPASNLINERDFYSSNPFPTNINDNQTSVAVSSLSAGAGHAHLSARSLNYNQYGFPSLYKLYTASTDGATEISLGIFNSQPDRTGTVDIPLGFKLNTNYLRIMPIELGQDNYSNFYLQLTGIMLCN